MHLQILTTSNTWLYMTPSRQRTKITCPALAEHTMSLEAVGRLRPTQGYTTKIEESSIEGANFILELPQDVIPEINSNIESLSTNNDDIVTEIRKRLTSNEIIELVIISRASATLNLPVRVRTAYIYIYIYIYSS